MPSGFMTILSNLISDFKILRVHSLVDDNTGEISSEDDRKRAKGREVLDGPGLHQLEQGIPVSAAHQDVQRINTRSFDLYQQILKYDERFCSIVKTYHGGVNK